MYKNVFHVFGSYTLKYFLAVKYHDAYNFLTVKYLRKRTYLYLLSLISLPILS